MISFLAIVTSCLQLIIYPAQIKRVTDGDTFVLYDLSATGEEKVRLAKVNAYEMSDSLGPKAKAYTTAWLAKGPFNFDVCSREKYGRLMPIVYRGSDTLYVDLIQQGLAVPYP